MGQQQLLLIVLGVIIVGIAVAVGINMFSSSAVDANRDAITADLANLAAKAQQYYKKPSTMGGGNNDFNGFTLGALDVSNDNGEYRVTTTAPRAAVATAPAAGNPEQISSSTQTMYIVGYGQETGQDGNNLVMAYATIDMTQPAGSQVSTTVLN
jgi:Tfp pilus assembly protein PilE